jgi:hypothetical protein
MTYTVYKIENDGKLSNKEHLDNIEEVNVWLTNRKFDLVMVVQDQTNKYRKLMHVGSGAYDKI